jgi:hypothetical protein
MKKSHKKILEDARNRYDEALSMETDNRKTSSICSQFVDGNQWDTDQKMFRRGRDRPIITINKLRKLITNKIGQVKRSKLGLTIIPTGGQASKEGALLRQALIRTVEYQSNAKAAYYTALQQAYEGGYGYFRMITEYEKDSFYQNIVIKRVPNRYSVIYDQNAQMPTYEDAEYAFVVDILSKDKFKNLWPNVKLPNNIEQPYGVNPWYTEDTVTIAEYFWKEPYREEVWKLESGRVVTPEEIERLYKTDTVDALLEEDPREDIRTQLSYKIKWVKMTHDKILEGPTDFPGDYIPIIPVLAYEFNDEGRRKFRGIAYDALDPSRLYNYYKVTIAELLAAAPKTTRMLTPEQIQGHQWMWDELSVNPRTYVLYNSIPDQPPPLKEDPMGIPMGAASEAQAASADILDTTGIYPSSLGQPSSDRTGRAIRTRNAAVDATMFPYVDNFLDSLLYCGKVLLSMIPEVYSSERIVHMLSENGELRAVTLNDNSVDLTSPELKQQIENDMNIGSYGAIPAIGAGYDTHRQETAASMMDLLQFAPAIWPIVLPRVAELMDWQGSRQISQEIQQLMQQQEVAQASGQSGKRGSTQQQGSTETTGTF